MWFFSKLHMGCHCTEDISVPQQSWVIAAYQTDCNGMSGCPFVKLHHKKEFKDILWMKNMQVVNSHHLFTKLGFGYRHIPQKKFKRIQCRWKNATQFNVFFKCASWNLIANTRRCKPELSLKSQWYIRRKAIIYDKLMLLRKTRIKSQ